MHLHSCKTEKKNDRSVKARNFRSIYTLSVSTSLALICSIQQENTCLLYNLISCVLVSFNLLILLSSFIAKNITWRPESSRFRQWQALKAMLSLYYLNNKSRSITYSSRAFNWMVAYLGFIWHIRILEWVLGKGSFGQEKPYNALNGHIFTCCLSYWNNLLYSKRKLDSFPEKHF